jgi:hypothetical protein
MVVYLWGGLTELVEGSQINTSPPMPFSDAFNKAKIENAREGTHPTHTRRRWRPSRGKRRRKRLHRLCPGNIDLGDHSDGGAHEEGASTGNPFDAIGMFGNLWRGRSWYDGADQNPLRFGLSPSRP